MFGTLWVVVSRPVSQACTVKLIDPGLRVELITAFMYDINCCMLENLKRTWMGKKEEARVRCSVEAPFTCCYIRLTDYIESLR